jgi:hypothetical protein
MVPTAQTLRAGLSGYLCGTHSGVLALGRGRGSRHYDPKVLAVAHRQFAPMHEADEALEIGRDRWNPSEQRELAESLRRALSDDSVIDLVLFGSQARGGRTGFSDVDAVLVITDEAAESATRLRALRRRILAAQRAVLRYQPMQHHGFEVVTPKLLLQARAAMTLPPIAFSEACSLKGTGIAARFAEMRFDGGAFSTFTASLERVQSWPTHPWEAHRHVSMFELLPTLYLQRHDVAVPKWRSFEEARADFDKDWWPYEVLAEVRDAWPRIRRPKLEWAAEVARNPWVPVAVWRRLRVPLPPAVRLLLTPRLLQGLLRLMRVMVDRSQ